MKFYILNDQERFNDRGNKYAYCEQAEKFKTGESLKCPNCKKSLGILPWLPPRNLKFSKTQIGDFSFGTVFPFIVSEKFRSVFEDNKLTGIKKFHKVQVTKVGRQEGTAFKQRYYLPQIENSFTEVDFLKSNISYGGVSTCAVCCKGMAPYYGFNGLVLKEETYDGKDIFSPYQLRGFEWISEKFREVMLQNDITNFKATESAEYYEDFGLKDEYFCNIL